MQFPGLYVDLVPKDGGNRFNGYLFGDTLHFHIRAGDIYVQVSYRVEAGRITVMGSSTKNRQGRYIAWSESIVRSTAAMAPKPSGVDAETIAS